MVNKAAAKKPKVTKATRTEVALRVAEVRDMLLARFPRHDVQTACAAKWDLKPRQIDKYISQAQALILDAKREENKIAIEAHLDFMGVIARRAILGDNLWAAIEAGKEIARVSGVYQPQEIMLRLPPDAVALLEKHNVNLDALAQQLVARLKALEASQ
jgi:hypothetical protein